MSVAEFGKNRRPVRADPRGRLRAGLRLTVEGKPGRREAFGRPAVTLARLELHRRGRMFAVTVGEFLGDSELDEADGWPWR